jgi:hypothetical protein
LGFEAYWKTQLRFNKSAIAAAITILEIDNAAAQWIGKDALKELQATSLKPLDSPRAIYRC